MITYETNVNDSVPILDSHYQAVLVPFDVEYNSVIGYEADVTVNVLDVCRGVPSSMFDICVPGL